MINIPTPSGEYAGVIKYALKPIFFVEPGYILRWGERTVKVVLDQPFWLIFVFDLFISGHVLDLFV